MERLLAEGVDIALVDTQSRTALLHSVIHKHDAITDILLAHHSVMVRSRLKGKRTRQDRGAASFRGRAGYGTSSKWGQGESGVGVAVDGAFDAVSGIQVWTIPPF